MDIVSGCHQEPLEWSARQKIAVGAARGLRYLHEECRVGCIVHRDMRPNNILLTHDFEPLVRITTLVGKFKIYLLILSLIVASLDKNQNTFSFCFILFQGAVF